MISALRLSSVIFRAHSTLPAASRKNLTSGFSALKLSAMALIGIDKLPAWKMVSVLASLLDVLHAAKDIAKTARAIILFIVTILRYVKKAYRIELKKQNSEKEFRNDLFEANRSLLPKIDVLNRALGYQSRKENPCRLQ